MAAKLPQRNYPALRIIAAWNKVFGYIVGALMLIGGLVALFGEGDNAIGLMLVIGAVVVVVASIAMAETIQVFLDTEDNTRSSADSLHQLVDLTQKSNDPPTKTPPPKLHKKPVPAAKATPEQARTIVTLIKNLREDGLSFDEIARELRSEGMPTLDGATGWTADAVASVLDDQ